jgi:hypothetical protein
MMVKYARLLNACLWGGLPKDELIRGISLVIMFHINRNLIDLLNIKKVQGALRPIEPFNIYCLGALIVLQQPFNHFYRVFLVGNCVSYAYEVSLSVTTFHGEV